MVAYDTSLTLPSPSTNPATPDVWGAIVNTAINKLKTALDTIINQKIEGTLATTRGDLLVATAAGIFARLPLGSDGMVLTADSTQTTGLKYATPVVGGGGGGATTLDGLTDVAVTAPAVGDLVYFDGTLFRNAQDVGRYVEKTGAPGILALGDIDTGGLRVVFPLTLKRIEYHFLRVPFGSNTIIEAFVTTRSTGIRASLGATTIAPGGSRNGYLVLATPVALVPGDRVFFVVNNVASLDPGADLQILLLGPNAPAITPLATPAAPTGIASAASGSDVSVTWTAPASGIYSGYDIYQDDFWVSRLPRSATSFVDAGEATNPHVYKLVAHNSDIVSAAVSTTYAPTGSIVDNGEFGTANTGASTVNTSLAMTATAAVPAGRVAFLAVSASGPTGGTVANVFSATDTKGNTWTVDEQSYVSGGTMQSVVLSSRITTALAIGDVVTLSATGNNMRAITMAGRSASGMKATGFVDTADNNNSSTTATKNFTTNTTGVLSVPKSYVLAVFSALPGTVTLGGGFTSGSAPTTTIGTNDRQLSYGYLITAATAAVTATGTSTVNSAYGAVIQAYQGA